MESYTETGYALLSPSLRRSMTLSWMAHLMCGFCWMAHLLCGFCSMIVRFFACLSCAFGSANVMSYTHHCKGETRSSNLTLYNTRYHHGAPPSPRATGHRSRARTRGGCGLES